MTVPRGRRDPRHPAGRTPRHVRFERGVVLASPEGDLVCWPRPTRAADDLPRGSTPSSKASRTDRAARLVREIDPATDPRLAALLPGARNLWWCRCSAKAATRARRRGPGAWRDVHGDASMGGVDGRAVRVAHAALALHSAWLTEDREAQLETIRGLERKLRAHNLELEVKVAERTEELRETIQSLEEIDEQRRRLLAHVVQAAEDERRRIANDIHDYPVQKMVVLKMRLELPREGESRSCRIWTTRETRSSARSGACATCSSISARPSSTRRDWARRSALLGQRRDRVRLVGRGRSRRRAFDPDARHLVPDRSGGAHQRA